MVYSTVSEVETRTTTKDDKKHIKEKSLKYSYLAYIVSVQHTLGWAMILIKMIMLILNTRTGFTERQYNVAHSYIK